MVGEYNKAKTEMQNQINDMAKAEPENPTIEDYSSNRETEIRKNGTNIEN